MKALRRLIAAVTVAILAFRAIGSFLSWVEKQDDSNTDAWIDEDEFEDAKLALIHISQVHAILAKVKFAVAK